MPRRKGYACPNCNHDWGRDRAGAIQCCMEHRRTQAVVDRLRNANRRRRLDRGKYSARLTPRTQMVLETAAALERDDLDATAPEIAARMRVSAHHVRVIVAELISLEYVEVVGHVDSNRVVEVTKLGERHVKDESLRSWLAHDRYQEPPPEVLTAIQLEIAIIRREKQLRGEPCLSRSTHDD